MARFSVLVILKYLYKVFSLYLSPIEKRSPIIPENNKCKFQLKTIIALISSDKTNNLTCKIMTINHDYRSRIMMMIIIIVVLASPDNAILLSPISALGLSIAFQLHWAKMHLRRTRSSFVKQHPHSFLTVPPHFPYYDGAPPSLSAPCQGWVGSLRVGNGRAQSPRELGLSSICWSSLLS